MEIKFGRLRQHALLHRGLADPPEPVGIIARCPRAAGKRLNGRQAWWFRKLTTAASLECLRMTAELRQRVIPMPTITKRLSFGGDA
jgi:hypothetical protein